MAEINNTYAYPNPDSYRSMREGTTNTTLSHGYICSMVKQGFGTAIGAAVLPSWTRTASQKYLKKFQFNPPSMAFDLAMVATEAAAAQTPGGNDTSATGAGVGAVATSLSLAFNRTIEVYKATAGSTAYPEYFKEIGVQKDVLDIYRVILGEDVPTALDGEESTEAMMGELFDSASAGRQVQGTRPVIISFNKALTYYGTVTGMRFEYQTFNYAMVPTFATVNISLDVLSISSRAAVQNQALTSNVPNPSATSGTSTSPATPSSTGSSTAVPNNEFGGAPRRPTVGQSVMW